MLKTIEIEPKTRAIIFAVELKNNWATKKARIKKKKKKKKKKPPQKKSRHDQTRNFFFFSIKDLTDDKLGTFYIKPFKIMDVKNTTVEMYLFDTRIFPKFHVSLIKKIPPEIPLTTIRNYSTGKNTK